MDIILNKNNSIPIGVQVKEQIKLLIYSGVYKNGDKLPSINELAEFLEVNKNTVVAVLKDLQKEGLVESHKGKGIFIKYKKTGKLIDDEFLHKIEMVIRESKKIGIGVNELISLIGCKFDSVNLHKKLKALFIMGISQQLVNVNVKRLRERIPEVEFEGMLISKKLEEEKLQSAVNNSDMIVIPNILYDFLKEHIPDGKKVIRTDADLKSLDGLKKLVEKKKKKIAVIGGNSSGAQTLAGIFVAAGLFKPKLVLSLENLEKCKKELKDIDLFVACLSTKEEVEKLKMKDKDIFYFSDYVNEENIKKIKMLLKELEK